jgi:hypothetical protein
MHLSINIATNILFWQPMSSPKAEEIRMYESRIPFLIVVCGPSSCVGGSPCGKVQRVGKARLASFSLALAEIGYDISVIKSNCSGSHVRRVRAGITDQTRVISYAHPRSPWREKDHVRFIARSKCSRHAGRGRTEIDYRIDPPCYGTAILLVLQMVGTGGYGDVG